MVDSGFWTATLAASAAIGGVLATVIADGAKDQRRLAHERAVRAEERQEAGAARRRSFELDNLILAYDSLWLLARESVKLHRVDRFAAESTEHGYGGTRVPEGTEADIAVTSQAVKTIRLILNEEVRTLALAAHTAMTTVSMLGIHAHLAGRGPVSLREGEAAEADAAVRTDAAMTAISDRIRALMAEH